MKGLEIHFISSFLLSKMQLSHSAEHNEINNLSWRRLHLSKAKLKASSRTSALLAGFAMVAMVEVQLSQGDCQGKPEEECKDDAVPEGLLIAFAICTTLLVSVHMLALMISTCILPNVEAASSIPSAEAVHESPHDKMRCCIETAWIFSTLFGILLCLCEIGLLCWVKFINYSKTAAISATVLLVPVMVVFLAFAIHFYRKLVSHQYERSEHGIRELENMINQLEAGDQIRPKTNHSVITI